MGIVAKRRKKRALRARDINEKLEIENRKKNNERKDVASNGGSPRLYFEK
jgi:hypothetical protein